MNNRRPRLKVLISAFSCQPGKGSEPGVGWACAVAMARHHDIVVLTRRRYRNLIEDALEQDPVSGLRFEFLDVPDWILRATKPSHSFQLFYYLWQLVAYFRARRLCRERDIDLIHHVTFCKYWAPSFMALLPVPFIWGPVGGGESTPRGFSQRFSARGRAYEYLRDVARWFGEHDPFVKLTARQSVVSLGTTKESADRMRKLGARSVSVFPSIGLTRDELAGFDAIPSRNQPTVRFLSVGRLIHWKGFDLGLSAFARANIPDAEFWIVGDGPERGNLESLARQYGIENKVRFCGSVDRNETLRIIGESDVLVHPSLHESGGLVCLEAMAARRPVLCLDVGGPSVQVTDDTGIRVAVQDCEQVTADLTAAMERLGRDTDLREKLGAAGRHHVETQYLWTEKAKYYCSLYSDVAFDPSVVEIKSQSPSNSNVHTVANCRSTASPFTATRMEETEFSHL